MPRAEVVSRENPEDTLYLDEETLDKTKHYRFVQERSSNIAKKRALGYEVVLRSETGVRLLTDGDEEKEPADDKIRVGDTILMMVDKATFDARRKRIQNLAAARLSGVKKDFHNQARQIGVRSLEGEEGEKP